MVIGSQGDCGHGRTASRMQRLDDLAQRPVRLFTENYLKGHEEQWELTKTMGDL
jgi:hypothetical protein